jgi:ParB family chromosome partitioning protein
MGCFNPSSFARPKRGTYAVVAGGRRLAALQLLAEQGKMADDKPIECSVIADDADATEISLAENSVREQMHPADEFEPSGSSSPKARPSMTLPPASVLRPASRAVHKADKSGKQTMHTDRRND